MPTGNMIRDVMEVTRPDENREPERFNMWLEILIAFMIAERHAERET